MSSAAPRRLAHLLAWQPTIAVDELLKIEELDPERMQSELGIDLGVRRNPSPSQAVPPLSRAAMERILSVYHRDFAAFGYPS